MTKLHVNRMGDGHFVAYDANEMVRTLNKHLLDGDTPGLHFKSNMIRDGVLSLGDLTISWHSNTAGWKYPWKDWVEIRRKGKLTATIPAGGTYEYRPAVRYRAIALVFKKAGWPIPLRSSVKQA